MGKYALERMPYPSDVTDEEWAILEPFSTANQSKPVLSEAMRVGTMGGESATRFAEISITC